MISLAPASACLLYLSLALASLLLVWLSDQWRRRRYQASILQRQRYVCEYCRFTYLEDPQERVHSCPQCGSFNREEIAKVPTNS